MRTREEIEDEIVRLEKFITLLGNRSVLDPNPNFFRGAYRYIRKFRNKSEKELRYELMLLERKISALPPIQPGSNDRIKIYSLHVRGSVILWLLGHKIIGLGRNHNPVNIQEAGESSVDQNIT